MAQVSALIRTLKKALKQRNITYADVAEQLKLSEANVKRQFSAERFTLDRLEDICGLMGLELTDLVELYQSERTQIQSFTQAQEQELVDDLQLLFVAVAARNRLTFDEIMHHYALDEATCIQCLAKLDRLKLIDLLPGNRIKLRIADNFHWIPNGPIERFFEKNIQVPFLRGGFAQEMADKRFTFGLLGEASARTIIRKCEQLVQTFNDLHQQDSQLPLESRMAVGLLTATRPWQFAAFQTMKKSAQETADATHCIPKNSASKRAAPKASAPQTNGPTNKNTPKKTRR